MQFTMLQIILIGLALLIVGGLFGKGFRTKDGDGFFSRVFKDNKDFDSTIDRVSLTAIIIFMLISFHDDFSEPQRASQITIIFLAMINLYQAMVTGKMAKDISTTNGHTTETDKDDKQQSA